MNLNKVPKYCMIIGSKGIKTILVVTIFLMGISAVAASEDEVVQVQCPETHPYVFGGGDYCCVDNKEDTISEYGVNCDGSVLYRDSLCCINPDKILCPDLTGPKCQSYGGWITVRPGEYLDLETTSLEFKTDSTAPTDEKVDLTMKDSSGGLIFELQILLQYDPPKYIVNSCIPSESDFPTTPSSAAEKVWKLTYSRSSDIRLKIHCNGEEVLNLLINAQTCYAVSNWNGYWTQIVNKTRFETADTASDQYRFAPAATCTALKDEWINTMETTTTFPAVEETVLEVTCSDAGAIKKGSSKVTCILGTDFSYSDEPSCSRPDSRTGH